MAFDRSATFKGAPLYEDLKAKLHFQPTAHADETFWRQDGINHFLWYAGNNEMALFHIDRHRSSNVAQSLLGDHFDVPMAMRPIMPLTQKSAKAAWRT
jgi:hypothetical protein